jgi:hypothetical protein
VGAQSRGGPARAAGAALPLTLRSEQDAGALTPIASELWR